MEWDIQPTFIEHWSSAMQLGDTDVQYFVMTLKELLLMMEMNA